MTDMHARGDAPSGAGQWLLAALALAVLAGTLVVEWARMIGR